MTSRSPHDDVVKQDQRKPRRTASWRTATAVNAALIGVLAGATGVGSYQFVTDANGAATNGETIASSSPESATNGTETTDAPQRINPFSTAAAGDCLTWDDTGGTVSNFERVDCAEPHRFEVSARQDLATYPASEFGPDASPPDVTRQAQLREELCLNSTLRYLDGRYDPSGKYSVASILPPSEYWEAGDRTLLCGLQSTDNEGTVLETVGAVADNDQARVAAPGTCMLIDSANQLQPVDCGEDHQLEITSIVDLNPVFPEGVPTQEDVDGYLRGVCEQAAMDYLGGEEALYQSTLQPFWLPLSESSWNGGSRSTNCALVHAAEGGGFSVLTGSATAGRDGFLIDGHPPADRPQRNPLRIEGPPLQQADPSPVEQPLW